MMPSETPTLSKHAYPADPGGLFHARRGRMAGMKLPRFGMKTLLIIATAIALWLSTFSAYTGHEDVRGFVMLSVAIGSGATAVYSGGAKRAFWGGFFAAIATMGARGTFLSFSPRFAWATQLAYNLAELLPGQANQNLRNLQATFAYLCSLLMAALIGLLCTYIYHQCRTTSEQRPKH
jgi:hypothetical protein